MNIFLRSVSISRLLWGSPSTRPWDLVLRILLKVLEIVVIMVLTFGGSTGIDLFDERF